jgi:hypothetical protein
MPTLLAIALASSAAVSGPTLPVCSWDEPGVNPFTGNVVAAVDRYRDIPAEVRARLKARMAKREYDEIATIGRDSITGRHRYAPEITDMHFGRGTVCRTVTRSRWPEKAIERGLVYCDSGHFLIVPTVCRNVSRVRRLDEPRAAADAAEAPQQASAGTGGGAGGGAAVPAEAPAQAASASATDELAFEAPGAGATSFADVAAGRSVGGGTGLPSAPAPLANASGGWSLPGPIAGMPYYGGGGGGGVIGGPGNVGSRGDEGPSGQGPVETGPLLPPVTDAPPPAPPLTPTLPPMPSPVPLPLPDSILAPLPAPVAVVPEPGTWALFGLGLAALAWRRRRA